MLLELGLAVGGGILNAAAGSAENDQLEKQRQEMLKILGESIIDPAELDHMLANVNKMFNNRLVNTLNSTAIRSRGIANSNVVKGATIGTLEGARLGTLEQTRFSAREANAKTRAAMVGVNLQTMPKGSFLGDFLEGGLQALPIGMELSKMMSPEVANTLAQTPANSTSPGISGDYSASRGIIGNNSPIAPNLQYNGPEYDSSNLTEGLDTFTKLWGRGF